MKMNLRGCAAVALILAFLLLFAETETIAEQAAFNRSKGEAKQNRRVRSAIKTVEKPVDGGFKKASVKNADVDNNSSGFSLPGYGSENIDREIAEALAPIFNQGIDSHPRYDYITNFDFDSDWRGDNNWKNAADTRFPLRAYVYYSVMETQTHYFVVYAVFHPRDYKGGNLGGPILSRLIAVAANALGRFDSTGRAAEATFAHENDLEGCLVVAEKLGSNLRDARVRFVETIAHNRFLRYEPRADTRRDGIGHVRLTGQRAELYIEPRGHGIYSYQPENMNSKPKNLLVYKYTGQAGDSSKWLGVGSVGYELTPLYTTLWSQALTGKNQTYAEAHDYQKLFTAISANRAVEREDRGNSISPKIGSAFRGQIGGSNMARPPWGWFDGKERDRPLGEWFFDPAGTVKRHFKLDESFSTVYTHAPVTGIAR